MEVLRDDAALPFKIDNAGANDSLDAVIAQALARWREGQLTVPNPLQSLRYDPSVDAHLAALLGWVARLRERLRAQ